MRPHTPLVTSVQDFSFPATNFVLLATKVKHSGASCMHTRKEPHTASLKNQGHVGCDISMRMKKTVVDWVLRKTAMH